MRGGERGQNDPSGLSALIEMAQQDKDELVGRYERKPMKPKRTQVTSIGVACEDTDMI